jgi:hypothetical protein
MAKYFSEIELFVLSELELSTLLVEISAHLGSEQDWNVLFKDENNDEFDEIKINDQLYHSSITQTKINYLQAIKEGKIKWVAFIYDEVRAWLKITSTETFEAFAEVKSDVPFFADDSKDLDLFDLESVFKDFGVDFDLKIFENTGFGSNPTYSINDSFINKYPKYLNCDQCVFSVPYEPSKAEINYSYKNAKNQLFEHKQNNHRNTL